MEFKVQVTREPVKKYDKQKLEVEVPCPGKEEGITWSARFTEDQLIDLTKQVTKKIQDGKEYIHILYEAIWLKMHSSIPKLDSFHPDMLKYVDEVLIAFTNSLIEMQEINKIKPIQKKLKLPE